MLVTVGTRAGAALEALLGWRYFVGAALLGILVQLEQVKLPSMDRWLRLFLLGMIGQGLVAGLGLSALRFIPPATSTFLFYTFPAWVTLFAAIRRIEPITRRKLIAVALALSGIAVMVGSPDVMPDYRGVLLAMSAAVVYAIYIPLIERATVDVPPVAGAFIVSIGASVAFLGLALISGALFKPLNATGMVVVLLLAVFGTTVAFRLFIAGLAVIGPVRTAIISTTEPISTALLGWAILAQRPGPSTVAGGALIVLAVIVLHLRLQRGHVSGADED